MNVLYEDNHLLVVDKPAGLATMGASEGKRSVYDWAVDYIGRRYNKPGKVFIGIVSRLDALTTGTLVLARTSKAASRLSIQFGGPGKHKKVSAPAEKLYLAIVEGDLEKDSALSPTGMLTDRVYKDDSAHRMRVDRNERRDAQEAKLQYCVLESSGGRSLLAVRLLTGRKHQIRLQLADRGHPILGDQKYGARQDFSPGVALHSWQLLITHPTTTDPLRFVAPIPNTWSAALPRAKSSGNDSAREAFGVLADPQKIESIAQSKLDWSIETDICNS